jgi:hypothetical protein
MIFFFTNVVNALKLTVKKGTAVHVQAMMAYRRRTIAPEGGEMSPSHPSHFISGERTPVPIELEAGLVPVLVWMFCREEKYFSLARNQTPEWSACSLVTTLTAN